MIAEALAVRHPSQVRRLVLCAAFPATGTVARPSQTEIDALTSGNPQETAAALFPSDRSVAYSAYVADTSAYPSAPPAPSATVTAQARAVTEWWDCREPLTHHGCADGLGAPVRKDVIANATVVGS